MKKVIYLDNAATTKVRPEVVEAMLPFYTENYGNPSSVYSFSTPCKEAMAHSREVIANALGANANEIYFTNGGTESDNWALTAAAEAYASKNKVLPSAIDGVVMGLGFTFALVLMGFFRELLGAGTILSGYVNGVNGIAVPFFNSNPMVMMILPAGGFLMMGFILAAIQKIMAGKEDK